MSSPKARPWLVCPNPHKGLFLRYEQHTRRWLGPDDARTMPKARGGWTSIRRFLTRRAADREVRRLLQDPRVVEVCVQHTSGRSYLLRASGRAT